MAEKEEVMDPLFIAGLIACGVVNIAALYVGIRIGLCIAERRVTL